MPAPAQMEMPFTRNSGWFFDGARRVLSEHTRPYRMAGRVTRGATTASAALETALDNSASSAQAAQGAIEQANDILVELDKVLQRMLELETFNELIAIVRSLLEDLSL